MTHSYSPFFQKLIENREKVGQLIAGCGMGSGECDLKVWEDRRLFLGGAFDKSGTALDIGCGNAFLLRSLQEWSGFDLVPYGIDVNPKLIDEAKDIFPEYSEHFLVYGVDTLMTQWPSTFPETFDFIYCSLWGRRDFNSQDAQTQLEILLKRISNSGRLILGLYGSNRFPFGSAEYEQERAN